MNVCMQRYTDKQLGNQSEWHPVKHTLYLFVGEFGIVIQHITEHTHRHTHTHTHTERERERNIRCVCVGVSVFRHNY